ncbi:Scn11a [Symbiodinium natans]|uniref:Scn11a protein n=1 Tax=Symbiodinium natans TaxID=878477 RepID=A0A812PWP8_9DINO|nr:Scn11a [Symbiodinium natans]
MAQEVMHRLPSSPPLTTSPELASPPPITFPKLSESQLLRKPTSLHSPRSPRSPDSSQEPKQLKPAFFKFGSASSLNIGNTETMFIGPTETEGPDVRTRHSITSSADPELDLPTTLPSADAPSKDVGDAPSKDVTNLEKLKKDRSTTISSLVTIQHTDKGGSSWDSIYLKGTHKEHQVKAVEAARKLSTLKSESATSVTSYRSLLDQEPKSIAGRLVTSTSFKVAMATVIFLNLVLLGIEVDYTRSLPPGEDPREFYWMNIVIVIIFIVELFLKVVAFGCRECFCGQEKWWNWFDLFIVGLSLFETIAEFVLEMASNQTQMDPSHLRIMRFLRLVRALRGIRVIRLLRYISALRTIVFSIISTLGSVFWTSLLLVVLFYLFGTLIAQVVSDHCRQVKFHSEDPQDCANEAMFGKLLHYWSSVPEAMLTLLMAITGGLSWNDALMPLRPISEIAVIGLLMYIVITVLAILNVVTGVFCNMAIESARADKDIAIMQQIHKHEAQVESLREIFHEIDLDGSNVITVVELKEAMKGQKMSSFMQSLDISTNDVFTLFMVIDADGSGEITLDEFVYGCMQLQGPAKGLQIARMSYENTIIRKELKHLRMDVKKVFQRLEQVRTVSKEVRELSRLRGRAHSESL